MSQLHEIEITAYGVEIRILNKQSQLEYTLIIDPMDTSMTQLLAEILETSQIFIDQCYY